jgi:carboxyl-terminal processing protease
MKSKNYILFPILFGLWFIFVGASKPDLYKKVKKNQALINDVYRHLITNYVDDIDLDAFTKMSIDNMLMDLDPYTVFLENEERSGIEMLTKGKYGGVGIQIGRRDNMLTVISPMENSPAKRAGILAGDRVIKIDGNETIDMTMDAAAKLIRGEKGTHVILTIERFGENGWIDYSLIREDIKVKDVSYFGMLDDQTGYIRLTRFSKNSTKEVKKAVKVLLDENMAGLIIDLRDNPGGLLNSAVDILDMFIDQGETLVWTAGKTRRSHRKYKSKSVPVIPNEINVAVLINQGSASASEIVSGVIQDLDRGVVIGRPSFGKGLVQTVYKIDRERSLKITTAKYYIPSGRLTYFGRYIGPGYAVRNQRRPNCNRRRRHFS